MSLLAIQNAERRVNEARRQLENAVLRGSSDSSIRCKKNTLDHYERQLEEAIRRTERENARKR